ncbi:hypothetical protein SERLADRAFT_357303 [Serpula lacrymans var. lacrymans S7.9]|uniref:F-box domain-containing protein n=1 Tax=Serpula lacrymans var. lacrymans (strain S7.9) TaxID=578457 RepID=F8P2Z0_SERL9|nr:uncharacterized protein SERLADRAFT_357303 [Serpula lacrymans var. lacrymans S7.9]EGO22522.1 hypothetical protein SERLADRAFT_357303 [Serpula lacrymans var. lacrymans S7.9]
MPIATPPTPAPSPRPFSTYDSFSQNAATASYEPAHLSRIEFANLASSGPAARRRYLVSLLNDCTTSELLYISSYIIPMLKRDFLRELPPEIAFHILNFVDDPRTLSRASQVCRRWNTLISDDWLWKKMCESHQFNLDSTSRKNIRRRDYGQDSDHDGLAHTKFSYRKHFQSAYATTSNWRRGGRILRAHRVPIVTPSNGVITSAAMDADWVVVALTSNHIHIFNATTGVLNRTLTGHEQGVWAVHLLSDVCSASEGWGQPNSLLVSGGCDKVLRVWDVKSGHCIYVLRGHTSTIRCIKVLHNRPIAVTGSRDWTLRVWDIQRGRMLRLLQGHQQSVRCLDVCGNRVVSGSYDTTCRIWNVDTGECLHVLEGHMHQLYSVAFDGVRVASGGLDTTVRVWDADTGECIALLQGHTALVCQLQLFSDMLATGGSDGRVITFSLSTFTTLQRIAAHDSSVTSLQFDQHFLVTGGNDGRVRLFETLTGNYIRDLTERCESVWKVVHKNGICAIMCKRAGKTVMEIWSFNPRE